MGWYFDEVHWFSHGIQKGELRVVAVEGRVIARHQHYYFNIFLVFLCLFERLFAHKRQEGLQIIVFLGRCVDCKLVLGGRLLEAGDRPKLFDVNNGLASLLVVLIVELGQIGFKGRVEYAVLD